MSRTTRRTAGQTSQFDDFETPASARRQRSSTSTTTTKSTREKDNKTPSSTKPTAASDSGSKASFVLPRRPNLVDEVVREEVMRLCRVLDRDQEQHIFRPDPSSLPGYKTIVATPMCFDSISARANKFGYQMNFEEFVEDFELMLSNCKQYNGQDSHYANIADTLRVDAQPEINASRDLVKQQQKEQDELERRILYFISNLDRAEEEHIFRDDPSGLPNYLKVCPHPMYTSLMADNVRRHHKYRRLEEFIDDFELMIENCKRYNGSESYYGKMARSLFKYAHALFSGKVTTAIEEEEREAVVASERPRTKTPSPQPSSSQQQHHDRSVSDDDGDDEGPDEREAVPEPKSMPPELAPTTSDPFKELDKKEEEEEVPKVEQAAPPRRLSGPVIRLSMPTKRDRENEARPLDVPSNLRQFLETREAMKDKLSFKADSIPDITVSDVLHVFEEKIEAIATLVVI
eukprot:PhM_4_TR3058/c0_g6_i1/m.97731